MGLSATWQLVQAAETDKTKRKQETRGRFRHRRNTRHSQGKVRIGVGIVTVVHIMGGNKEVGRSVWNLEYIGARLDKEKR